MILKSKKNGYGDHNTYSLEMDEAEFRQALEGKPLYRLTASNITVGEWEVRFKKFSKAKIKRMNLV